ncbi:MerR family transcriptional regulator [Actinomadura sp. WMMB 499]|uniref:MerR family transcriptional regulator n=1 Tax=Actinomadura sp. WMMB 499 TaxID=1219491 RepID=UPI0034A0B4A2
MTPRILRPVDLAREHGLSAQAVRNYEEDGILPPAGRSASGYRRYTALHAQALRAFLALRAGYGHRTAAELMRAAGRDDDEALFRLIDRAHAELLHERDVLDQVAVALGDLTAAPAPGDRRAELPIGALAHQLGMHPASLRKWEDAGILRPNRDPVTGRRGYPPDVVRDAHVARQLRRGGYPLRRIELFVGQLRAAGTPPPSRTSSPNGASVSGTGAARCSRPERTSTTT